MEVWHTEIGMAMKNYSDIPPYEDPYIKQLSYLSE